MSCVLSSVGKKTHFWRGWVTFECKTAWSFKKYWTARIRNHNTLNAPISGASGFRPVFPVAKTKEWSNERNISFLSWSTFFFVVLFTDLKPSTISNIRHFDHPQIEVCTKICSLVGSNNSGPFGHRPFYLYAVNFIHLQTKYWGQFTNYSHAVIYAFVQTHAWVKTGHKYTSLCQTLRRRRQRALTCSRSTWSIPFGLSPMYSISVKVSMFALCQKVDRSPSNAAEKGCVFLSGQVCVVYREDPKSSW